MNVFTFPGIGISVCSPLSLCNGAVQFSFPFLGGSKVRLGLGAISFGDFPSDWNGRKVMREETSINAGVGVPTVDLCRVCSFLQA